MGRLGTNESGRFEIYVRPFAERAAEGAPSEQAGGQWQVSTAGGMYPLWRRDGKELYYIAPDGKLMAASIAVNSATPEPVRPVALFQTRMVGATDANAGLNYNVTRDGRFLINTIVEDAASPITLLQNWKPAAK